MNRYDKYKDSSIFWSSVIPVHWRETKLKHILQKMSRSKSENAELLVCSNKGKVIKRGDSKMGLVADDESIYQGVKKGDLLIHGMDTWHGAIAISNYDGMCTPVVHVCESLQNKEYISYYLQNMAYSKIFKLISNGVRQNTSDFRSWDKLGNVNIPLPPLSEQTAIASYLKDKTSKIEQYVTERERERELLESLKQSEIANAVTKGLNPNVPMKDSGIPWIGMIPEHWEVKKMRNIFKLAHGKANEERTDLLSLSQYTGIKFKSDCEKTGMFEAESTIGYNIVHQGQFVMNIMLAWNGSYAVSKLDGIISPSYCIFDFKVDCDKRYFDFLLRTEMYQGIFKANSKGLIDSRLRLYPNYFFPISVIVPPIEEQKAIGNYIEDKLQKIDTCIADLQAEIDYLKEFKQRLVSDVVTGQICVAEPQKGRLQ